MSVATYTAKRSVQIGGLAIVIALGSMAVLTAMGYPLLTTGFVGRSFQAATPIAIAAIGGLYAEKSGVFNIGLDGFMIIGAIMAAVVMYTLGGTGASQGQLLAAVLGAVVVATVLAVLFAVILIRYQADQIVAGLGVWFIGLGFAPFLSSVIWGSVNRTGMTSISNPVPGVSFSPFVILGIIAVVAAWFFLYRTRYGYWIQAAGENPEALDTAGIDVNRVRYATVIFSGAMAGLGGAIVLAHAGSWVGTGETMVDGRGWIAIVSYLFGNYNPLGAGAAALLFGALDMLNVQFQAANFDDFISSRLVNLLPYVGVLVVLTAAGTTRMPSAVGEPYESED
ncbi:ABC transporter permease [Halobacteria archaeon AArc-dxtr1]|nr:ABC transporter permease [Halobacteria archaeon AArc-dxtr1]